MASETDTERTDDARTRERTERTRRIVTPFFEDHDVDALAPDVRYTNVGTGEEFEGREAVAGLLDSFYEHPFDGSSEPTHT